MSGLQTLVANIAANTLTTDEQAILIVALNALIPTFPTPDEIASADAVRLAELEMVSALFAINAGDGGVVPPVGGITEVDGVEPIEVTTVGTVATVKIAPGSQSQVPVWDTGPNRYDIRQLTQDDILPGFSIVSFTGSQTVETGATITNPAFAASYSSTPASASLTNTDGVDSPLALTTPFTAGTFVGAFTHSAPATVGVTLTAVSGVTRTAGASLTWASRTFGGVGAAGASSATASGTSAVLNGGAGTLGSEGLFLSIVGQSFGPFAPSAQKIYVLTPHTSTPHTFKDQNGFAFAMNAPTTFSFTNEPGAALSMDLYESTNTLSSSFTLTVQS